MAFLSKPIVFIIFGIAGAVIAMLSALLAGIMYRGKERERYSPLNHFISELGEVGVSKLAWAFNLSLVLAGLALVPASITLGVLLHGFLAKLALAAGVICAVSLGLVGVFPMNQIKPHGKAAMAYFRSGLVMVLLFSLAIAFQPGDETLIPRLYGLAGLPPMFSFGSFLVLIGRAAQKEDDPLSTEEVERPRVWTLAVVEWSIFLTVLLWFVLIAVGLG